MGSSRTLMGLAPIVPKTGVEAAQSGSQPPPTAPSEAASAEANVAPASPEVLTAALSSELQSLRAAVPEAPSEAIPEELPPPALDESSSPVSAASAPSSASRSAATTPSIEPEQTSAHSVAAPDAPPRSPRGVGWLLVAIIALGVGGYWSTHRAASQTPEAARPASLPVAAAEPPAPAAPQPVAEPQADPAAAAPSLGEPVADPAPAPVASANSAASAIAPSASAAAPSAPNTHLVTIDTTPPKAKFFHAGKEVGTAPFAVEVPEGEKRAFEVFLPGHVTHKVVVDGSKPKVSIGLKPLQ